MIQLPLLAVMVNGTVSSIVVAIGVGLLFGIGLAFGSTAIPLITQFYRLNIIVLRAVALMPVRMPV